MAVNVESIQLALDLYYKNWSRRIIVPILYNILKIIT